jgi:hypothetical protein
MLKAPARRQRLWDEDQRLQPVFHAMEKYFASFPRYGKLSSTVWKTRGNASARAIRYPDLRARPLAPKCEMKKRAEQGVAGYAPQVARPQNADVRQ